MYKIVITKLNHSPVTAEGVKFDLELYSQTTEALNLRAVIDAINSGEPAKKAKKPRSDKGVPRKPAQATAGLEGK